MKLFDAGFNRVRALVVAEDEKEAIEKVNIKLNLHALPVDAVEIDEIDGYKVKLAKSQVKDTD